MLVPVAPRYQAFGIVSHTPNHQQIHGLVDEGFDGVEMRSDRQDPRLNRKPDLRPDGTATGSRLTLATSIIVCLVVPQGPTP